MIISKRDITIIAAALTAGYFVGRNQDKIQNSATKVLHTLGVNLQRRWLNLRHDVTQMRKNRYTYALLLLLLITFRDKNLTEI